MKKITKYFSFKGRIRRSEYVLSYAISVIINYSSPFLLNYYNGEIIIHSFLILNLLMVWFALAQSVKRCHDLGLKGWWLLIIPFIFFVLLFSGGERGENNYGEDPRGGIEEEEEEEEEGIKNERWHYVDGFGGESIIDKEVE